MGEVEKERILAFCHPDLAKEWHPTLNGDKTPYNVTCGSNYIATWILPYDDPETGKHFDFVWKSSVYNRCAGKKCPYLTGNKVWPGFNDLASRFPDLVAEWHPTLNGDKTPYNVAYGSEYNATWILHYDDPETGKHFDFVWKAYVYRRSAGEKCPYLTGKKVWPGFNDLASKCPDLIAEWHPTLNGDKTPYNVTYGSGYKATWIHPYDDPETGKHFDFVWKSCVQKRSAGEKCPYLTGKKVWPGFNDLATKCPELKDQFHPTKNGKLTAYDITPYSNNDEIWWIYPYDDPVTGKHFDFEWQSAPATRMITRGCPFISNQKVWPGYNDLKTKFPEIAKEWDYKKNKGKPEDYMPNSRELVWWRYPYDDPETGNHYDFSWQSRITNRVQDNSGCPYLSNNAVWEGYNDLASKRPDLAEEWDYEKNKGVTPNKITLCSGYKRWWKCSRCGKSMYISPAKRAKGQNCSCLNCR